MAWLAWLPHVLDRPAREKRGSGEVSRTAVLPPEPDGRGGRTAGGEPGAYAASASGSSSRSSSSRSDAARWPSRSTVVSAPLVDHERVAVERDERGREHRPHELPHGGAQRAVAAGERVAELARHALGAERLGAGDAVGVEHERGCPAGGELGDAAQRVGVGERALELGVEDRVGLARLVAAGVADGLLALGVGPAGAVGDHLAVVAGEQLADDLAERVELAVGGVDQPGADVVAEPEVAAGRLGVAGARLRPALLVLGGRVAELVVVEAGAGEVRLLAGGRVSPSPSCSWTRSSMNTGSTTQIPAAKSCPRSCTNA